MKILLTQYTDTVIQWHKCNDSNTCPQGMEKELRHSNSIRNILIAFDGESKRQATSNPARITRMCLEWAGMHLKCISIAAGIYFDIKIIQLHGMQFECKSNAIWIFRLLLECSRNVPIGPRRSPDIIQNTAESHIQEYIENFHSDVINPPLVWLGFEIPSRMWREYWKFFIHGWFCFIPANSE